jgi:hypothetical protein
VWTVGNERIGAITSITGTRSSQAIYTAQGIGNNTIGVVDANGNSATASIIQTSNTVVNGGNGGTPPLP